MLPSFPYMTMAITGVLHVLLGSTIFINIAIGLNMNIRFLPYNELHLHKYVIEAFQQNLQQKVKSILGVVVGCSLWMIMVGSLGILAGAKRLENQRTHKLKIAYMVTAILSAVIFSLTGLIISIAVQKFLPIIGLVVSVCSVADFLLSIVSSSICCCCANSTPSFTGVLFVQPQGPENHQPGNNPPANYPPPYPGPVQLYPGPQVRQEGVTNLGYQLSVVPSNYTAHNEVA